MNDISKLTEIINTQISISAMIFDLGMTALCAYTLRWFYLKFGQSLSNRFKLANNFVTLAITTALVITVVKSSLALSLGLVGALSIVRFRTAIKEPEELAFLFLCIGLGLGFGAQQRLVTVVAFITILLLLFLQRFIAERQEKSHFLHISFSFNKFKKFSLQSWLDIVKKETQLIDIKKIDLNNKQVFLLAALDLKNSQSIQSLISELNKVYPGCEISFIDATGMMG